MACHFNQIISQFFTPMKKWCATLLLVIIASSFRMVRERNPYKAYYFTSLDNFQRQQQVLLDKIKIADLSSPQGIASIKKEIAYKKINGPLPVEWEHEVFEKFEKPCKREGAGLSLAELYLNTKNANKDSLAQLIRISSDALTTFRQDSITGQLDTAANFFLCNRLYLLNLAAIYTTGFECPNNDNIIPELRSMLSGVKDIYTVFNQTFPLPPLAIGTRCKKDREKNRKVFLSMV